MTVELVRFCGLQTSGKTSFYRERLAGTHVHISKDAWPNARKKEKRQCRLVDDYLGAGRSVVVDNTNPTPAERGPLVTIARARGANVTVYSFVTTVSEALRRNAERVGRARIDDVGILSVAKRYVPPSEIEGFDEIFEVRLSETGFVIVEHGRRT